VVFAIGPQVALKSAVTATSTLPIVMQANDYDPLALGYVARALYSPGAMSPAFSFNKPSWSQSSWSS